MIIILLGTINFCSYSQNYNNIINYNVNGIPVNGIKIKTNLPYTTSSQMPTITIKGYNYGTSQTIGLQIVYYIFGSPANFIHASISSSGAYTPQVTLANEGGLVVIFINDKPYYQRFTVSAFANGLSADGVASYTGWTVADEALTGTNQLVLPYTNSFSGTVNMPGNGIWNPSGNVGIGTTNPYTYMLAVNGSAIATSMTVKLFANWPDYVFKKDYHLPSLNDLKIYVDRNQHLPGMPSEQEIAKDGINLGEMDKLLVKKVEELTLYIIEKDKELKDQTKKAQKQEIVIQEQENRIRAIEDKLMKLTKTDVKSQK